MATYYGIAFSLALACLFFNADGGRELVPTYFGRKYKNGNYIDATIKANWFKITLRPVTSILQNSEATLNVEPPLAKNGQYVKVTWKGVQGATAKDMIALYCPEKAKTNDYLDFFNVDESSTYSQGYGEYSVRVYNVRTNCEMRYFRNYSQGHQELVATSNTVVFEGGPEQPLQVHLALTGKPSEMGVMWVSGTDQTPMVKFGRSKTELDSVVEGKSQTYTADDFCSLQGKFINPGYIHDVLLSALEPSTIYYYSCGIPGHMSPVRSFKTAPQIGPDVDFKFIVYGDHGILPAADSTAKNVLKDVQNGYEFIFHNGDISYARGMEYIWEQWHALIEPYSSIAPYMVGIGNHEQNHIDNSGKDPSGVKGDGWHPWWGTMDDDSHGECGVPMFYRFHMPDNGNYLWWYSYDYGMVHFIMISTEHDLSPGTRQYKWLEEDLKSIDRSKTPWVILGGHRPMYTSEIDPRNFIVALAFQFLFEDLLYHYKVDVAFWAHYHSYERTCAVYKNQCVDDGIVHIVIGTAGKEADWPPYLPPDWSKFRRHIDPYGYGRVTLANRSALHFEYFVNSENKVVDQVWLYKND
ncbi:nucleotide pyrophosphatase/phosphodiesterase-like [Dendronephthya gigantea]|uniref:nucleotide pyrophosphatase/phosphodiesterase-like n=1 Tax=Dendronephthya gigantea TaxID=151771 RepID=UPI00106CCE34|nr:nucleotide pyrophosphatase/phosphodiesterase-like [Dendronephthya gigantea]